MYTPNYTPEQKEFLEKKFKTIKFYHRQDKYFSAKSIAEKTKEREESKPRSSWFSVPMRTIGKGLDYLYTLNPLDVAESIAGSIKATADVGKKFVSAPHKIYQISKYKKEVKELEKKKAQGKISKKDFTSRINFINQEAQKISQEYRPRTAVSDAATAVSTIAALTPTGRLAKIGLGAVAKGAVKKTLTRKGISKAITPTIPKATGMFGAKRGLQFITADRFRSAPAGQAIHKAAKAFAGGKVITDIARKTIPGGEERFKPIKLMKEGPAREALRFGGAMVTPLPFIGATFQKISKVKKYTATASEYQSAEPAFKKFFGKAIDDVSVFKNKDVRAGAESYIIGVMKEKGIFVNEKNIAKFLDNIYSPKVQDLPMVSNSIKRLLKSNGIEKVDDVSKMTDDMLKGILKNKEDVKAIKEAIEEMGKTSFTGMHFKTPEEQLKALAVFGHKGVHSGTWRGTAKELRAEVMKSYDEIAKGIKGPEIKTKGIPKTPEKIKKYLSGLTTKKGWETNLEKLKNRQEFLKSQIGKSESAFTRKRLKEELKNIREKIKLIEGQKIIRETTAKIPIIPPKKIKFIAREKWGGWTNKTAKELGFDNLYSQGVRELPKGDASFLSGRKAELGRAINKLKEDKLGKLLTPQSSREIYSKIRTKLDKSVVKAFGKDAGKAEKLIHETLGEPLLKKWGKKIIPIYKPTERELGISAWKNVVSKITGKSLDSDDVLKLAKKLDNDARAAFVTSMKEAGVPTYIVDKMRAASGFYNWAYYNLYTLPRFQLRVGFWWQQVPEVYEWGTVRASKFKAGSLIRKALGKQINLKRTLNRKSELSKTQKIIEGTMLGQTEDITTSGVRGMLFHKKNEANAYGLATIIETDKALNSMPIVRNYLKKHGLKSAEEIPYLKKTFYAPLADDAEELGKIINKYGFGGAKAHLADPTKTVLKQGRETAVFDNAIREALKIAKPNAYKEAIPLFLYNPNRSALEKSLHAWPMFPLSYTLKLAERGGGYILEGKAIRPKIFASIINVTQEFHENEKIKEMEKKYWNLFNVAEAWSPHDPSYDFSTGFLPPFSKMLWKWAENPEYYLDKEKGPERSLKVLWPAYREAKGWEQVYNNIIRLHKKVRESDKMTEKEALEILENFRYKAPEEIQTREMPKLPPRPEKEKKIKIKITPKEKAFQKKKERREKLLETPGAEIKKKEKSKYEGIIKAAKNKKEIPKMPARKKYFNP